MTKISVPIATVPGEDQGADQVVVTDEKVYTRRHADLLQTMGSLPEGAKIIEDAPEPVEDAPVVDDLEEEGEVVDEPAEPDETPLQTEDTPVAEPIVDEGTPEYDEDGFKYDALGADEYRQSEDGTVYWKTKIDGIEEWLTKKAIQAGYQLRKYSDQKLQEVSQREKDLESQKEIDSVMNRYLPKPDSLEADLSDDEFGESPAAGANDKGELAQLRKQVAELSTIVSTGQKQTEEQKEIDKRGRIMTASYDSAREFYGASGIDLPEEPSDRVMARVNAFAENNSTDIYTVFSNPAYLVKALNGIKTKKPTSSVKEPPASLESSRKSQPADDEATTLSKRLKKLNDDEAAGNVVNPSSITVERMQIRRRLKELKGA